jgi:hypothetical protein
LKKFIKAALLKAKLPLNSTGKKWLRKTLLSPLYQQLLNNEVYMQTVSTVSALVAQQVREQLKTHKIVLHVIEFESDEVFLTNNNGLVIRVSRTGPESGEIVVDQGDSTIKSLVSSDEIQSFQTFFQIPLV